MAIEFDLVCGDNHVDSCTAIVSGHKRTSRNFVAIDMDVDKNLTTALVSCDIISLALAQKIITKVLDKAMYESTLSPDQLSAISNITKEEEDG